MSLLALARAWMASARWGGWRVGMVSTRGYTCCYAADEVWFAAGWHHTVKPEQLENLIPDLTHFGTLAFLLEDVRRAWGDPHAFLWFDVEIEEWVLEIPSAGDHVCAYGDESPAEALLLALHAASEAA